MEIEWSLLASRQMDEICIPVYKQLILSVAEPQEGE